MWGSESWRLPEAANTSATPRPGPHFVLGLVFSDHFTRFREVSDSIPPAAGVSERALDSSLGLDLV